MSKEDTISHMGSECSCIEQKDNESTSTFIQKERPVPLPSLPNLNWRRESSEIGMKITKVVHKWITKMKTEYAVWKIQKVFKGNFVRKNCVRKFSETIS